MRRAVLLAAGLCLVAPGYALGQAGSCQLIDSQTFERRAQGGFQTIFIIAPVVQCTGGARITANEGTIYEVNSEIHMAGSVSFRDVERRLTADRAIYSSVTGRLFATGNVVFTDEPEGMTLRGPELEYYRAMPNRPNAQAIATQRPHLTLMPRQREGSPPAAEPEPIEIDADRMTMIGNDHYTATGRVEIRRTDFDAFSNEAQVYQLNERMELRGNARIHGEQFDLTGERIDVHLPEDRLERVHALRDAVLVGEDLRIDAPDLQLFFADDLLQRMVARNAGAGGARPVASARAFRLEADSLDALVPEQKLDRVIAIGDARGESLDTVNAPAGRLTRAAPAGNLADGDRDWILGDTVTGFFVAVEPAGDTAGLESSTADAPDERRTVELEKVVARGSASSLYRVHNSQAGGQQRPGLNYLVGELIELSFRDGELSVADVRGLQRGLYLDPEDEPASPEIDEAVEPGAGAEPTAGAGSPRTSGSG